MMGHNICFNGDLWIIITKLSLLLLLTCIWSSALCTRFMHGKYAICISGKLGHVGNDTQ